MVCKKYILIRLIHTRKAGSKELTKVRTQHFASVSYAALHPITVSFVYQYRMIWENIPYTHFSVFKHFHGEKRQYHFAPQGMRMLATGSKTQTILCDAKRMSFTYPIVLLDYTFPMHNQGGRQLIKLVPDTGKNCLCIKFWDNAYFVGCTFLFPRRFFVQIDASFCSNMYGIANA